MDIALKNRFPGARFRINCFNEINDPSDIETLILTYKKVIIYSVHSVVEKFIGPNVIYDDNFLIYKKEGQEHILVCDVIDQLIAYGFHRDAIQSKSMDSIEKKSLASHNNRNKNSIPIYHSEWN
jgi:hypothetical protein